MNMNMNTYCPVPLPTFQGNGDAAEDIENFQFMMDSRREIQGWTTDEDRKILLQSLGEPALRVVMAIEKKDRDSYDKVMSILLEEYSKKTTSFDACAKLMAVKQEKGQAIKEYVKQFKKLVKATLANWPEEGLVQQFRRGLYIPEDGFAIIKGEAKTLDKAIQLVEKREEIRHFKLKELTDLKQKDSVTETVDQEKSSPIILNKENSENKEEKIEKKIAKEEGNLQPAVDDLTQKLAKMELNFMEVMKRRDQPRYDQPRYDQPRYDQNRRDIPRPMPHQIPRPNNCSMCGVEGHNRTSCPRITCRTCNESGHMSYLCPKRSATPNSNNYPTTPNSGKD